MDFYSRLACVGVSVCFACGGQKNQPLEPDPVHDLAPSPSATGTPVVANQSPDKARGVKALEAGRTEEAKAAFESAMASDPNDAEVHYYVGLLAERVGDKKAAEAHYRTALKIQPSLENAATNVMALQIEAGKLDDAIAVGRAFNAKRTDSAAAHLNLGIALAEKGGLEADARKEFGSAATLAPKDAMTLLTIGQWLAKWKDVDAVVKLKAAGDAAGDDVGLLAAAGFELKNVGAFKECIGVLDRAIAKKEAAELRTYRALCKMGDKNKDGAVEDLRTAIAKEPAYGPAHFYLAGRLAEDKKRDEAIREYEAYLKLEPKGPLASKADERIKLLRAKKK